jgi:hypothetical protein
MSSIFLDSLAVDIERLNRINLTCRCANTWTRPAQAGRAAGDRAVRRGSRRAAAAPIRTMPGIDRGARLGGVLPAVRIELYLSDPARRPIAAARHSRHACLGSMKAMSRCARMAVDLVGVRHRSCDRGRRADAEAGWPAYLFLRRCRACRDLLQRMKADPDAVRAGVVGLDRDTVLQGCDGTPRCMRRKLAEARGRRALARRCCRPKLFGGDWRA